MRGPVPRGLAHEGGHPPDNPVWSSRDLDETGLPGEEERQVTMGRSLQTWPVQRAEAWGGEEKVYKGNHGSDAQPLRSAS